MSTVYLAEHLSLGRKVALKLLAPELSADVRFRERFVRESRMAAGMEHPNIIPIYEAGEADGVLFIAMRLVRGTDLKALIEREGQLEPARTVAIIRQVASALDAAHVEGLVHRDVKTANILVAPGPEGSDHVYLSDFGLTKRPDSRSGLTKTGQFLGSVDYVAPEQIEGKAIDGRADVYSLGCVLFECLTGRVPFERDSEMAVLWAHMQAPPPSVSDVRPGLPSALDPVLAKAMAKAADDRYPTCQAFAIAAREALGASTGERPTPGGDDVLSAPSPPSPPARRRTSLVVVAVVGILAAVVAVAVTRTRGGESASPPPSSPPAGSPTPASFLNVRGALRIDPSTNRVVAAVPIDEACCVNLGGGALWVGLRGHMDKVSLAENSVVAHLGPLTTPQFGDGQAWVLDLRGDTPRLGEFDPAANRIKRSFPPPVSNPAVGPVVGEGGVWIGDPDKGFFRIDPTTGKSTDYPFQAGTLVSLAVGGAGVWAADRPNNTVWHLDVATRRVQAIPLHDPTGIVVTQGGVWIGDGSDGELIEFSLDGSQLLATVKIGSGSGVYRLNVAAGAGSIWVVDTPDSTVSRVDESTREVVARIKVGLGPADIAADDSSVWVTR
jgi:serine/threonine-protein kinase